MWLHAESDSNVQTEPSCEVLWGEPTVWMTNASRLMIKIMSPGVGRLWFHKSNERRPSPRETQVLSVSHKSPVIKTTPIQRHGQRRGPHT